MSSGKSQPNYKRNAKNVGKADLILQAQAELSKSLEGVSLEIRRQNARLENVLAQVDKTKQNTEYSARQLSEVYDALHGEYEEVRRDLKFLAKQSESVFSELSQKLGAILSALGGRTAPAEGAPAYTGVTADIDYDKLAQKILEIMPAQEVISPDYIACKVAEQIVLPEGISGEAGRAYAAENPEIVSVSSAGPVDIHLDEDELADKIALKVGSLKAEDFDIIVDDGGCTSISNAIADRMNYDIIAAAVAEKLRSAIDATSSAEMDYDEMAARIGEKISVSGISEDAIADKAAQAITDSMPEIDSDEIADKVVTQILSGMPAVEVNSEEICKTISDKLIESQADHDYDIVIDEDGLGKITEYVSGEVLKSTDARFDEVDKNIAEIKALLASGAVLRALDGKDDYVAEDSTIVTVSDVVEEEPPAEEQDEVMQEIVEDIDEAPTDDEKIPDGLTDEEGGVDFEHMMKYNRSFIARIIQSTDDQKEYYGRVKTALLSYAKVNSSISWSSERFNKGRDTIARFKIRGKTLCLYLALDPSEYKYSVYHHSDVSDNKSMHGTPLMVKIKSPLGAKKAIRLIDDMLTRMGAVKRTKITERDYALMYPYAGTDELIEDGLIKDVDKN